MILRVLAVAAATALALLAAAAAQDPSWAIVRPNITWDNHWKVEPAPHALFSVLDEPVYVDQQPVLSGDRALATRPKQRFAVGFSDAASAAETLARGRVAWEAAVRVRLGRVPLAGKGESAPDGGRVWALQCRFASHALRDGAS